MVVDNASHTVVLFGGWDGSRDLAVPSRKWSLLSPDTEAEGGPMPRSCHEMVIDSVYRQVMMMIIMMMMTVMILMMIIIMTAGRSSCWAGTWSAACATSSATSHLSLSV